MSNESLLVEEYSAVLNELKARVRGARLRAQRRVNTELIDLYWGIGRTILERQTVGFWGSHILDQIARDLRAEFPEMTGFSRTNLKYMRAFAQAWPDEASSNRDAAGQLPWGHIMILLGKVHDTAARDWYVSRSLEHGWSRNVLTNQVMSRAWERTGSAVSNFRSHLASPDSELADQLARDPYVFDFLGLSGEVQERGLEQALVSRLIETLRELGAGFAFVGRQVHFDIDGDDFYLDLLFFHVDQLRYVVVELKTGKFKPEYAGKLGFYVALVDDRMRRPSHAPSVGILICGSRNESTVRYSLGQTHSPMAVSTYTYDALPPRERAALPSEDALASAFALVRSESDEGH